MADTIGMAPCARLFAWLTVPLLFGGCLPRWPDDAAEVDTAADDEGLPPLPPSPPMTAGSTGPWTDDDAGQTNGADGDDHGDGPGTTSDDGGGDETGSTDDGADLPGPDPTSAQLRLWQVLADPAGKDGAPDGPEFVEIHNPGPGPASLAGVTLHATSWPDLVLVDTWLGSTSLTEDQSLVIFRFSADAIAPVIPAATATVVGSGGLRNADGSVVLVDAGGEPIDALVYGGPSSEPATSSWTGPAAPDPGADEALCRIDAPPGPGRAGPTGAESWSVCTPRPGTMALAGPGPLRITEVAAGQASDSGGENTGEFIELVNDSSNDVQLDGWKLRVGGSDELLELIAVPHPCSPSPCVAAGDRLLLVHDEYTGAFGDAGVVVPMDGRLGSAGLDPDAIVELVRPDGQVASSHRRWPDPSGPPIPASITQSLARSAGDPDTPDTWTLQTPSPGE